MHIPAWATCLAECFHFLLTCGPLSQAELFPEDTDMVTKTPGQRLGVNLLKSLYK